MWQKILSSKHDRTKAEEIIRELERREERKKKETRRIIEERSKKYTCNE